MDGWTGFSDEDLRRLKQTPDGPKDRGVLKDSSKVGANRSAQSRKSNLKSGPVKRVPDASGVDLPAEQRLSTSSSNTGTAVADNVLQRNQQRGVSSKQEDEMQVRKNGQKAKSMGTGVASSVRDTNHNVENQSERTVQEKPDAETAEMILDEQLILKHEIADLEKFREHQKMIEEQNKKKKQMLAAAIQERQKKTKAEAAKLDVIKKELERLDQMVNADVSVIRNRIEEVSREFLEAQKRYDRAEKEFVDAKLDLNKKSTQKEQLTEHLYTVIHQNEQRKAKKLSQLMTKLEMEGEDGLVDDNSPVPPVPVCLISPTETRKGCLQSLGLALLSPPATVATEGKIGEMANVSTESEKTSSQEIPAPSDPASATKSDSASIVSDDQPVSKECAVSIQSDNAAVSSTTPVTRTNEADSVVSTEVSPEANNNK